MVPNLIRVSQAPPPPAFQPQQPKPSEDIWKIEHPAINDPKERQVATELRARFLEWQTNDAEWLKNTEIELDFLSGQHWLEEETGRDRRQEMEAIGRSAFTIDLLNPDIDLIVNQIRVNKLTANFIPVAEGADDATADVRQGLYRNIERQSKAAIARETGYQFAVSVGRGYWRVTIEDEDGPTLAKRIGIQRIDNLKSVAIDPTVLDFTYSDAAWAYVFDEMFRDEFRAEHGMEVPLDVNGLLLPDAERLVWFPKDKIRVGEYFRRVWKRREVWRLEDGTECWKEDAPDGATPVKTKQKLDYSIEYRKMTGTQTIEKRVWPGRFMPIIVCIGREQFRGKRPKIHTGMVRPAMHPSRIHDYMFSRMVDEVGLSPLPHLFTPEGSLGIEQQNIVNNINRFPWSVVTYTPKEDGQGRALPPPQWTSPSPNVAAVVQAAELSSQKLDRVLTTFSPNRGQAIADQSGRAIREIKDAGDISHAAFPDNFNRALYQEAVVVNDLMDVVYTEAQAITITQPDERTKQVLINQEYQDKKTGKTMKHMFGAGKYNVAISAGPSYPTRQAEASQRLLDLAKEFPQMAQVLDLIIGDLNIPNAEKYKDRLRPPGFSDDENGPSITQLKQHILQQEQNAQQADQLIQKLLQKIHELGSGEAMKRLEIASRERIAAAGNQTTIIASEIKAGQEATHAVLMAQLQAILKAMELQQPSDDSGTSDGSGGPGPLTANAPAPDAGPPPQLSAPQPGGQQ